MKTKALSLLLSLVLIWSCAMGIDKSDSTKDKTCNIGESGFLAYPFMSYRLGSWPKLGKLTEEPLLEELENEINLKFNPYNKERTDDLKFPVNLRLIDKIKSPYLKSEYWLVFGTSSGNYLGLMPPFTVFYTRTDSLSDLICLDIFEKGPSLSWPPRFDIAADYISKDLKTELLNDLDSNAVLEIAAEVVCLSSPERPIFIIEDIYDICEYTQTIWDDLVWEQYLAEDTVKKLLSSYCVKDLHNNKYLQKNYLIMPNYEDSSYYSPYEEFVKPPILNRFENDLWQVTLTTFSPDRGILVKWIVEWQKGIGLKINREIIKEDLSFSFIWL